MTDYIKIPEKSSGVSLQENLLFPTPVYHIKAVDVPSTVNRDAIVDFCLKRRIIDPSGRVRSNAGGWQSDDLVENTIKSPSLLSLWDVVIDCCKAIASKQKIATWYEFYVTSAWINIINPSYNDYHVSHCHPQTWYSAVYYAQTIERHGALVLHDPRPAAAFAIPHIEEPVDMYNQPSLHIVPEQGDLILMPGWLFHSVFGKGRDPEDNIEDVERIVIASNVQIK